MKRAELKNYNSYLGLCSLLHHTDLDASSLSAFASLTKFKIDYLSV